MTLLNKYHNTCKLFRVMQDPVLCGLIGEPINQLAILTGEPLKLTGKQALRKALGPSQAQKYPSQM